MRLSTGCAPGKAPVGAGVAKTKAAGQSSHAQRAAGAGSALGVLPLLLGLQLLGTHAQLTPEEKKNSKEEDMSYFLPPAVEFAQYAFNLHSKDPYAYRLVRILRKWKEKDALKLIVSMELDLSRTTCGKFEEDIDNCDFQPPPGSHTVSCFFTIQTEPWASLFQLLNSTCVDKNS